MPAALILTCEHAGNIIPEEYLYLFKEKEEILYSHKAIDLGALRLAKKLAAETNLPLYYTTYSRLLVEANRSLDNEELFSDFTKNLPENKKSQLLDNYYFPHRNEVTAHIAKEIAAGKQVYHLSGHSFTPVLEGKVREAEIGILFDPNRPAEKDFAQKLKTNLLAENLNRKVMYNSPYPGTTDGLPNYLRKQFLPHQYAGFELEVNQKFFLDGEPDVWQRLVSEIISAFRKTTGELPKN